MLDDAKAYHEKLVEKVSESDDKLLEKYLGGETITEAELKAALRKRCIESVRKEEAPFVPVICGTAFKNKGVQPMLDAVVDYLPSPLDIPPVTGIDPDAKDENKIERSADDKEPFSALAFKIMTDPFVGQLTFFRVYSGTLTSGSSVINSTKGRTERIGRLLKMHANKREEIKEVNAGDIAAAVGLKSVTTGDTLCDEKKPIILEKMVFPEPVISLAIEPKTKADQEKLGQGMAKLMAEDPTFRVTHRRADRPGRDRRHGRAAPRDHRRPPQARVRRRSQRRQAAGRLQGNAHQAGRRPRPVQAPDRRPRPVRRLPGSACSRCRPAPATSSRTRPSAARFRASSSSRSTRASRKRSRAASSPATRSTTSASSCSTARTTTSTRRKWRSRLPARWRSRTPPRRPAPVLMEPVMRVEVVCPKDNLGDVMGDLASRRGRIQSQEDRGGTQIISARVPLSDMFGYATDLRSRTQGRATYSMFFDRYEQAPRNVSEEVIARVQGTK